MNIIEITNRNATELVPYLDTLLRGCTFFAVDLEFSGIDQDGRSDCDAPEQAIRSLVREPADLYPEKLEALKPYTMMQIGISVFTEAAAGDAIKTSKAKEKSASAAMSGAAAYLHNELSEFLKTEVDIITNTETITVVNNFFVDLKSKAKGLRAALQYVAERMVAVTQLLEATTSAPLSVQETSNIVKDQSIVAVSRHYRFLKALSGALLRYGREGTESRATKTSASAESSVVRYNVQTFFAMMFPTPDDSAAAVALNINTAEFLVKNEMDLTRWIKEGLRFSPVKVAAARLAKEALETAQHLSTISEPHTTLPHYREYIGDRLDHLFPLSLAELQLVRFVLALLKGSSTDYALGRVGHFYLNELQSLISVARGVAPESVLPETIYTKEKVLRDETEALAAIGIKKVNRRFARIADFTGGCKTSESSLVSHCHGDFLLETLMCASELYGKSIVFFNGYTDLFFLLLSRYGPDNMPPDLSSFKSLVRRHFPSLYDTRILSCAASLQHLGTFTGRLSSVVDEMLKLRCFATHVFFTYDSLVSGGSEATQHLIAHNAGFDALLTGKLFAFAKYGLECAHVSLKNYENRLATYTTLLSIDVEGSKDSALPEVSDEIFYMTNESGLRAEAIHDTLLADGITSLVMYRGKGYTIQPVADACRLYNLKKTVEQLLSEKAHTKVDLYRVLLP